MTIISFPRINTIQRSAKRIDTKYTYLEQDVTDEYFPRSAILDFIRRKWWFNERTIALHLSGNKDSSLRDPDIYNMPSLPSEACRLGTAYDQYRHSQRISSQSTWSLKATIPSHSDFHGLRNGLWNRALSSDDVPRSSIVGWYCAKPSALAHPYH